MKIAFWVITCTQFELAISLPLFLVKSLSIIVITCQLKEESVIFVILFWTRFSWFNENGESGKNTKLAHIIISSSVLTWPVYPNS